MLLWTRGTRSGLVRKGTLKWSWHCKCLSSYPRERMLEAERRFMKEGHVSIPMFLSRHCSFGVDAPRTCLQTKSVGQFSPAVKRTFPSRQQQ